MNKLPFISIVVPVKNSSLFLEECLDSLKKQTYKNWELIAVDNNSTDISWEILKKFAKKDKRIKVYQVKKSDGVSATVNFAISKAKGDLIARMDADDVAFPNRLEKQSKFLQRHPKVVSVGGQCTLIDEEGKKIGTKNFPTDFDSIKKMIFWQIPLQQPTIMINKALLPNRFPWYDESFEVAEEIDLLFKLFSLGEVRNLKDYVLKYRIHNKNISLKNPKKTFYLTLKSRIKGVFKYGYLPSMKGLVFSLLQVSLVSLLPKSWIYPLYKKMSKFFWSP